MDTQQSQSGQQDATPTSIPIRMAKPDQDDINAAFNIAVILSNLHSGYHIPRNEQDEEGPTWFDEDDKEHLAALHHRLKVEIEKSPGGLFRVVGSMDVIMRHDTLDPDKDYVALHPRLERTIPAEPPLELLVSMAVRFDHGFGLLSHRTQQMRIGQMRQLYEEIAGTGFFHESRKAFYLGMLKPEGEEGIDGSI